MTASSELAPLQRAALMIGISDAHDRKTICRTEQQTLLDRLRRILFKANVARPLADPKLEALRELAMSTAPGKGFWAACNYIEEVLEPSLILAARYFLADRGLPQIKADSIACLMRGPERADDLLMIVSKIRHPIE